MIRRRQLDFIDEILNKIKVTKINLDTKKIQRPLNS